MDIIKQNLAKSKTQHSVEDSIKEMNKSGFLSVLFSRLKDEHTLDYIVKLTKVVE